MAVIGRPRSRIKLQSHCALCGALIEWLSSPDHPLERRFCNQRCHLAFECNRRRKLPSREDVVRLYVEDGLGTPEIAKRFGVTDPHTVRSQLILAGVKLRRHTVKQICSFAGCGKTVVKIRHSINASEYGSLCQTHRALHRRLLGRAQTRKDREIPPERYKPSQWKDEVGEAYRDVAATVKKLHKLLI